MLFENLAEIFSAEVFPPKFLEINVCEWLVNFTYTWPCFYTQIFGGGDILFLPYACVRTAGEGGLQQAWTRLSLQLCECQFYIGVAMFLHKYLEGEIWGWGVKVTENR